ncbi:MAG: elongation factor G [Gemmatimonadaceae bacterium]
MRDYAGGEIRNVAVVGHGASGKTTLVDSLAFVSGSSKRRGSPRLGTALTDYAPEEIARKYSINLGCAHAEWMGSKINLVDIPGYLDFHGEALAGLAAADGALVVVSATGGIEVGTERVFREAVRRRDPILFVVTMMDAEHADFDRVFAQIRARLTKRVIPVEVPIRDGNTFCGILNLFEKKARFFTPGTRSGEYEDRDIPEDLRPQFDYYYRELIETVASTDDSLLERYLDRGDITAAEAVAAMKEGMKRMELFPLFCCSAELTFGTREILTKLVELMPSAVEMEELHALTGAEGDRVVEIHADDERPFSAHVFKTVSEPHVGDVSYFRVMSGAVVAGQEVFNATRDSVERLNHLAISQGRDRIEVTRLHAGDIGCVAKLKNTHTNDTLSTREHPVRLPLVAFPEPLVAFAVHAAARADEDKLQSGLHRLHDEDPTFETHYDADTQETIVTGMGERHLEVTMDKLLRKYGVTAELTRPRIAYRETLRAAGQGHGRHKKQTGGRGQFGDCWVRLKPAPRGSGYSFTDAIVGGAIPNKFIPAVDRGIQEAAQRGVLAGFPVVDFEAELFDGSFHSVDSNEMAFKMAGILAFTTIAPTCRPVLLEPIDEVEITTPEAYLGDVMGDLSARRGHILGTDAASQDTETVVRAYVPHAELHLYATQLHSLTHGRANFTRRAHGYEEVPGDAVQRVVEAAAKQKRGSPELTPA